MMVVVMVMKMVELKVDSMVVLKVVLQGIQKAELLVVEMV